MANPNRAFHADREAAIAKANRAAKAELRAREKVERVYAVFVLDTESGWSHVMNDHDFNVAAKRARGLQSGGWPARVQQLPNNTQIVIDWMVGELNKNGDT